MMDFEQLQEIANRYGLSVQKVAAGEGGFFLDEERLELTDSRVLKQMIEHTPRELSFAFKKEIYEYELENGNLAA